MAITALTYNQILSRIKQIVNNHKQIKSYQKGLASDVLNEHTTIYPAAVLQDNGTANISIAQKRSSFPFRLFLIDLVNISNDTKTNEDEVISDMFSVAADLIAVLSNSIYSDWRISSDNPVQFLYEEGADMYGGVALDFSVQTIFNKDRCQVPQSSGGGDTNTFTAYWGWLDNSSILTEEQIEAAEHSGAFGVNTNVFADYTENNISRFLWLAIPTTEPVRVEWYANMLSYGGFGANELFANPVIVGGYSYYITNYKTKQTQSIISFKK